MAAQSLVSLAAEAAGCTRCPLYRDATQTVFGEGGGEATIVLVGEQPGDQEDRAGRPFVGPAGRILDEALTAAGIDRALTYVTNAVKHFKFEPRGKRRLHKRPNQGEVQACRWWLDRELALIRPRLVVALGATAAHALMGKAVTLGRLRGRPTGFAGGYAGLITVHPSSILRMPDEAARHAAFDAFAADLKVARRLAAA